MNNYKQQAVLSMFKSMGAEVKGDKVHLNGRSTVVPDYRMIDEKRLKVMRHNLGVTGKCTPA